MLVTDLDVNIWYLVSDIFISIINFHKSTSTVEGENLWLYFDFHNLYISHIRTCESMTAALFIIRLKKNSKIDPIFSRVLSLSRLDDIKHYHIPLRPIPLLRPAAGARRTNRLLDLGGLSARRPLLDMSYMWIESRFKTMGKQISSEILLSSIPLQRENASNNDKELMIHKTATAEGIDVKILTNGLTWLVLVQFSFLRM